MRQLSLLKKPSLQCGGSPKAPHSLRTLSSKVPMHLILKTGKPISLFRERDRIMGVLKKQAKSFGIEIYTWGIEKNHIHLSLKISSRENYKKWIRATTGLIARILGKGLWSYRPFIRVLSGFGKDFAALNDYIFRNEMEAFKIWKYDRSKTIRELAKTTRTGIFRA